MDINGNKKVAVIAVHGVGDHAEFETARTVAAMLSSLDHNGQGPTRYEPFEEEKVDVTLIQPRLSSLSERSRTDGVFSERSDHIQSLHADLTREYNDPTDFGHELMKEQLEKVVVPPDAPPYRTVRLKSKRHSAGKADRTVHVYELYWDDLSRVGKGFFAIFGDLYQLLLHLPSIGRKSVDYARAESPKSILWRCHSTLQAMATRFLTLPIPIFNLFLLAAFLTALPGFLPSWAKAPVALGIPFILIGAWPFWRFLTRSANSFGTFLLWAVAPAVIVGLAAALHWLLNRIWGQPPDGYSYEKLLGIEWWLLANITICVIASKYEKMRKGALVLTIGTAAFTFTVFLFSLWNSDNSVFGVAASGIQVGEILFVALLICWGIFSTCAIAAGCFGLFAEAKTWFPRSKAQPIERDIKLRGARAAFTARISLALSVTGFVLVALAFYSALNRVGTPMFPASASYHSVMNAFIPRAFPKSGLLHESDFRPDPNVMNSVTRNAVDQFAGYLKTTNDGNAKILKDRAPEINQVLTEYNYSKQHRAKLVSALNDMLMTDPKPEHSFRVRNVVSTCPGTEPTGFAPNRDERLLAQRLSFQAAFPGSFHNICRRDDLYLSEVFDRLLSLTATPALIIAFVGIAASLLLALWALLPSVLSEAVSGLRNLPDGAPMGFWMDNGLRLLRVSAEFLYWPMIVVLPLGSFLYLLVQIGPGETIHSIISHFPFLPGLLDRGLQGSGEIVYWMGVLITSSAVGLLAFRGRIESLALGLRSPLQGALDVDNWLRESPVGSTPRGLISARYLSLLRALLDPKQQPKGEQYDSIVIIAHSQGTVITADLLRFLNRPEETAGVTHSPQKEANGLDALGSTCPVYFLTIGSPLRQAYGLRFPHLYVWARHSETDPRNPTRLIPPDLAPSPTELGIKKWVSAYRSGDYIGRYFWVKNDQDGPWIIYNPTDSDPHFAFDEKNTRRELCIGTGAHVHYLDSETDPRAAIVAGELDDLISDHDGGSPVVTIAQADTSLSLVESSTEVRPEALQKISV